MPEEAEPYVRVMATGRSDYQNQINNVLCFPGFFRGMLDAGARINEEMKLAAAHALAEIVSDEEVSQEYIMPSVFDRDVAPAVAKAVVEEARRGGHRPRLGGDGHVLDDRVVRLGSGGG